MRGWGVGLEWLYGLHDTEHGSTQDSTKPSLNPNPAPNPATPTKQRQHAKLQQRAAEAAAARKTRSAREVSKAAAVRAQKAIWERALEARIMLQRPLAAAAALPRGAGRDAAAAASGDVRRG